MAGASVRSRLSLILLLLAFASCASAFPITFSGSIADPGNANLFGSDLGAPSFDDSSNNVAIYTFNVPTLQAISFTSDGYADGGFDPYFSLFSGSGTVATFLASNFDNAFFGPGGDFVEIVTLPAGDYTVAISVFANMSFAENLGTGTLADGFIGLGFGDLGDGGYRIVAAEASPPPPLPEPPTPALLAGAALAVTFLRRLKRRRVFQYRTPSPSLSTGQQRQ
jgi:hypothetical protein